MHLHQPRGGGCISRHRAASASLWIVNIPAPLTAECTLTDVAAELAAVRRFTRLTLLAWASEVAVDDALLIVTELATNALLHAGGRPVLRLSVTGTELRIEVYDDSPAPPVRRAAGADGGWGLALVERLSSAWGTTRHGRGKLVWCALPAKSAELAG